MTDVRPGGARALGRGLLGCVAAMIVFFGVTAQPAIASVGSSAALSDGSAGVVDQGQAGADASATAAPKQAQTDPAMQTQPTEGGTPAVGSESTAPSAGGSVPTSDAPAPPDSGAAGSKPEADLTSPPDETGSSKAERATSTDPEQSASTGRPAEPGPPARAARSSGAADSHAQGRTEGEQRATSPVMGSLGDAGTLAALLASTHTASRQSPVTRGGETRSRRPAEAGAVQHRIPFQPMMPDGDGNGRSSAASAAGSAAGGPGISDVAAAWVLLLTSAMCILRATSGTAWQLLRDRRGQPHPD